ncbi:MAG: UDP-N-acetylmuramoyl-L-alanine--D-glutamate ligase [bacterium]|nr:UDP-N-acetylmuramoyl-L-alanine--D-glutamate ligase [bacterium]MDE0439509.1 UDP-N-acetylmuramoyl-L-alanine--D-glutamate ligase [bacterium]
MKTLVLGAGISGRAASRLLGRLDLDHVVYDRCAASLRPLAASGTGTVAGPWEPSLLSGVELVVTSPGFSPSSHPLRAASEAGIPVWSEVELAIRHLRCPVVAVTGTNGKTTVVEQATEMLQESGVRAVAAGNIGRALSDVVFDEWDVVVLEVSSFQLVGTYSLAPRVAVVVNVAADHLDWHGSPAAYREAKARIFRHFTADDLLVYDADDPGASALARIAPGRKSPVTGSDRLPANRYGFVQGGLRLPAGTVPVNEMPAIDPAYRVNLTAAAVAATEMGAGPGSVAGVVGRFHHRSHRRDVVGEWAGVTWVNDSKATNPHAASAAIRCYPSVVLIAGGRNKGLDLAPIVALPNIRLLIGLGEAGPELLRRSRGRPARLAGSMEQAVDMAGAHAISGDTVLLSPGCASFDMFASYEERGEVFGRLVRRHIEAARLATAGIGMDPG